MRFTDLDYDQFLRENAYFFEVWKGALSHSELCRMDIYTRYRYIEELNEWIRIKKKKNQGNTIDLDSEDY